MLILGAEDYTGLQPEHGARAVPGRSTSTTTRTPWRDAGIGYDVYDVDANGRTAPSYLGVLSHYKAVVWYTGDDFIVRGPTGAARPAAAADRHRRSSSTTRSSLPGLHERGRKAPRDRQVRARRARGTSSSTTRSGRRRPSRSARQNIQIGQGALANDPPGQNFNCVVGLERLPAVLARRVPADLAVDPATPAARDAARWAAPRSGSTVPTRPTTRTTCTRC